MSTPAIETTKEVRFSVVMYGGVSLAIYINGVAQELFHLSRATAPVHGDAKQHPAAIPGTEIESSERVYRKVAYLLGDKELLADYQRYATDFLAAEKDPKHGSPEAEPPTDPLQFVVDANRPIPTRFIVDVLSGTSAGGINALYLAKAFANNQRIDQLKDLWINEGDLDLLLNDQKSVTGTGLLNQSPPQSLLNSRRMYAKLLKSLNDMEESNPSTDDFNSPFVDELDLFITATDIEGVPVPLRLADSVVFERRHKNVFHFRYGKEEVVGMHFNDFQRKLNPFLAFAARCTSSFPFAFEPMRLCDIDEVLNVVGGEQKACPSDNEFWQKFFTEELDPKTGAAIRPPRFSIRAFGDGGYLDNKPFSYATDTIINRQSDVPVDRKLIYVEPSPEHPEDFPGLAERPNALQNVKAALLDLPAYETIREDLQRILERNHLIARVNRIIRGTEKDVSNLIRSTSLEDTAKWRPPIGTGSGTGSLETPENPNKAKANDDWSKKDLTDVAETYGRYILPYRRLRIASVTDDIAKLIARLLKFDENSDQFLAIRYIVKAWREDNFLDFRRNESDEQKETVNGFLHHYDFAYRLRRLNFVRNKVDQLTRLDSSIVEDINNYCLSFDEANKAGIDWTKMAESHLQAHLLEHAKLLQPFLKEPPDEEFRDVLRFIKVELNQIFTELRTHARLLRSRQGVPTTKSQTSDTKSQTSDTKSQISENPLLQHIKELGITAATLNGILGMTDSSGLANSEQEQDETIAMERARAALKEGNTGKVLIDTGAELAAQLKVAFDSAREKSKALFDLKNPPSPICESGRRLVEKTDGLLQSKMAHAIRGFVGYYFSNFDDYDQISFPILYETEVGEADQIEVIRISPEDATSLIDERKELRNSPDPQKARRKLAGVALHHFGAFLDRGWRQNDIMWGRLDGAERLIAALLPGKTNENVRTLLTREANLAILKEELRPESLKALQSLITQSLLEAGTGTPISVAIQSGLEGLSDVSQKQQLEKIVTLSIADNELLDFMSKGYEVNRRLDAEGMLKLIARATQIIGNLFEQLANENGIEGKRLRWIAQLGRIFWGMIEVAVPKNVPHLLARRWVFVLYTFEVITILGGIILAQPRAQEFGWTALSITAFLNILTLFLRDKMQGEGPVKVIVIVAAVSVISILTLIGALKVLGLVGFTVSDAHLAPLTWLSSLVFPVLDRIVPFASKLPSLLLLGFVLTFIIVLNLAGIKTFSWLSRLFGSRASDHRFKPITLQRLRKENMSNVRVAKTAGQLTYSVLATLSATPPPNWIQKFENKWQQQPELQMRVYGNNLSFTIDQSRLKTVWQEIKQGVTTVNEEYAKDLKEQNEKFANLQKQLLDSKDLARDEKWQIFKQLS